MTHGIMSVASKVKVEKSLIELASAYRSGPKVETGFFIMYLGSDLELTDGTLIQNMSATKYSVIQANSRSRVKVSNGIIFKNNKATKRNGAAIGLQSCDDSTISDTLFENNGQTDVSA